MNIAVRYYTRTGNTKKLADVNGVIMAEEEFHCRGAFSVMHRNRPNTQDLQNVAAFAKSVI